ncbi:MAG: hypothetical protein MJ236_07575, partial [Clostridia bacterium]|nr:hypothetical protein [Clostridia bacterium]
MTIRRVLSRLFKAATSIALSFAIFATSGIIVPATTADYYDPGFCRVGGVFVNNAGAPIPGAFRRGVDVSYHQGDINWA